MSRPSSPAARSVSPHSRAFAFVLFALVIVWGAATAAQALIAVPIAGVGPARRLATGDLNGDGHADLVGAFEWSGAGTNISVAIGDGAGGFSSVAGYFSGPEPSAVAVGDMNGDGRQDVVATNRNRFDPGGSVAVLLGDGTGALAAPITYPLDSALAVTTGDFTGDGVPDAAVLNGRSLTILTIDGAGNLSMVSTVAVNPAGSSLSSIAAADFDLDDKLDVAIVSYSLVFGTNTALTTFRGNGDGTFGARVDYQANAQGGGYFSFGTQFAALAIGDLDDDGDADIVVTSQGHNAFPAAAAGWVMLNDGAGGFPSPTKYPQSVGVTGVAIGDMNDDGDPDVVIADLAAASVNQFFNDGTGALGGAVRTGTQGSEWVVLGDFNNSGAGTLDIVVSRTFIDPAILLIGESAPSDSTPPAITPTITGTLGGDGWYTSDVTVAWSVADPETEFTTAGCDTQTVSSDTSGTTFTCSATSTGGTSTESVTIMRDTTAPVVASATANPSVLWPPNKRMVAVTVSVDASDAGSGQAACSIDSVSSNEGGSAHEPDVELTGALTMNLRAERHGKGSGRLYTAQISCTDAAGNVSAATATVSVPHDQRKK